MSRTSLIMSKRIVLLIATSLLVVSSQAAVLRAELRVPLVNGTIQRYVNASSYRASPLVAINFLQSNVHLEKTSPLRSLVGRYDAVVLIAKALDTDSLGSETSEILSAFDELRRVDADFGSGVVLSSFNGVRVVFSPTGPLNRDFDDVRAFFDAARNGVMRALSAGAKNPLLVLPKSFAPFNDFNVDSNILLGALDAIYVPLAVRELPGRERKVHGLGVLNFHGDEKRFDYILSLEAGRIVYRDIALTDPEKMSPTRADRYVQEVFLSSPNSRITVRVISKRDQLEKEYPLLAAVDRAAQHTPRHAARVILLDYSDGNPSEVLGFVGKGVTYDSGGYDIKTGGHMIGMSRDKGGAAAVAGLFQSLAMARPRNTRVLGALCLVRNSVGADGYVADEVLTARSGMRIRVTNTDAEGRLAMADALSQMRERILDEGIESKAHLFTIATLTGAAMLSVGFPYSIAMDNGPALRRNTSMSLQYAGEQVGDMIEVSRLRREDYLALPALSESEDMGQLKNGSRGFQYPAAFLLKASGLDKHGLDSERPIAFTHMDIAGSLFANFPKPIHVGPISAINYHYFYNSN